MPFFEVQIDLDEIADELTFEQIKGMYFAFEDADESLMLDKRQARILQGLIDRVSLEGDEQELEQLLVNHRFPMVVKHPALKVPYGT